MLPPAPLLLSLLLALAAADEGCWQQRPKPPIPVVPTGHKVVPLPAGTDAFYTAFYTKYTNVGGITIATSKDVDDNALLSSRRALATILNTMSCADRDGLTANYPRLYISPRTMDDRTRFDEAPENVALRPGIGGAQMMRQLAFTTTIDKVWQWCPCVSVSLCMHLSLSRVRARARSLALSLARSLVSFSVPPPPPCL